MTDVKHKRWVSLLLVLVIYLLVEGSCYLSLLILRTRFNISYRPSVSSLSDEQRAALREFIANREGKHVSQDPVLGWTYRSDTNSAGMRDNRKYERVPPAGVVRISAFGDSFTWGSGVELQETWEKQLTTIASSIEVLNYGVGAYGLDQAYLRYLQLGVEYNPHIVFIGFMSENIARNVNVFRPFYSRFYGNVIFTKPRFKVKDGDLLLLDNPVSSIEDHENLLNNEREVLKRLGENDYHYQRGYRQGRLDFLPSIRFAKILWMTLKKKFSSHIFERDGMYNVDSEAYTVTVRIFDAFYRKVVEDGALPIILVFPDTRDQQRSRSSEIRRYAPLLNYFSLKGYRFIDMLGALEPYESRYAMDELVVEWGHYSPLGSRIMAEYLFTRLEDWGLTSRVGVEEALHGERERAGQALSAPARAQDEPETRQDFLRRR